MTMRISLHCLLVAVLMATVAVAEDEPELEKLHRAVKNLAARHYPQVTSHVFRHNIHFEHNTRTYVIPSLNKTRPGTKPPLAVTRGPQDGGVYCDLSLYRGVYESQRAEGIINRGPFLELFMQPMAESGKWSLDVILRLPSGKNAKISKGFVSEFQALMREFDQYVDN